MNAMPSLHVGWTLLCLLYVSRSGWGPRLVAVVVLALTVCATLVSGEHYLVDLVVAVPLAVAIRGAFFLETGRRARVVVGGGGLAVVLAWTVSGRLGLLANCSLPWSWTVVTVTVSLSLAGLAWISRQASKPAPAVGR